MSPGPADSRLAVSASGSGPPHFGNNRASSARRVNSCGLTGGFPRNRFHFNSSTTPMLVHGLQEFQETGACGGGTSTQLHVTVVEAELHAVTDDDLRVRWGRTSIGHAELRIAGEGQPAPNAGVEDGAARRRSQPGRRRPRAATLLPSGAPQASGAGPPLAGADEPGGDGSECPRVESQEPTLDAGVDTDPANGVLRLHGWLGGRLAEFR